MGTHDNLISELRQDITGKNVTRWVKPHSDAPETSVIPAPIATLPVDDITIRKELVGELHDIIALTRYGSEDSWGNITRLDTETIKCLIEYDEGENDSSENIGKWVTNYAHDNRRVRELATYGSAFDPATDSDFIEYTVELIRTYEELPEMDDYSKADPALKQLIHGLLHITDTMYSESFDEDPENTAKKITDPALRELVFAHPDKAEHIASVIADRDTTDADTIREVILSAVPALSEGAL